MTSVHHHPRALRVRRLRRWAIGIGLGLAAAITLGWIIIASMLKAAPPWWRQVRVQEQRTREIAQEVENALGTHLHLAREGEKKPDGMWRSEPWGVSIPSSDANAWLNARLPRWLETVDAGFELPDQIAEVQVEFRDGRVSIGVAGRLGERLGGAVASAIEEEPRDAEESTARRIIWASASPRIDEHGLLSLTLDRVYVGRLPISRALLAEIAERAGLTQKAGASGGGAWVDLLHGEAVKVEPLMKLEDGRRVRITGLRAREGRLEVTCVTEHGG